MKQSKECKLRVEINFVLQNRSKSSCSVFVVLALGIQHMASTGRFTLLKVGKCNILNHAS